MPYDANQEPVKISSGSDQAQAFRPARSGSCAVFGAAPPPEPWRWLPVPLSAMLAWSGFGKRSPPSSSRSRRQSRRPAPPSRLSRSSSSKIRPPTRQTVRDLTADRDRLKGRVASLEQSLEDITGTIKKQAAQNAIKDQPKEIAKPVRAATVRKCCAINAGDHCAANYCRGRAAANRKTRNHGHTGPDHGLDPPPAMATPPTIAAPVPLPPTRTASAAPDAQVGAVPAATRQIGIDIGGAISLEALRAQWATIRKAEPGQIGLKPAFMLRHKVSGATDYRLVLGPLANSTAALRLRQNGDKPHRLPCGFFTVEELASPSDCGVPRAAA